MQKKILVVCPVANRFFVVELLRLLVLVFCFVGFLFLPALFWLSLFAYFLLSLLRIRVLQLMITDIFSEISGENS